MLNIYFSLIIILFLLNSCVILKDKYKNNNMDLDFNNIISFNEFKKKLNTYATNSDYPNIDN